jgi:hypothetical protein
MRGRNAEGGESTVFAEKKEVSAQGRRSWLAGTGGAWENEKLQVARGFPLCATSHWRYRLGV